VLNLTSCAGWQQWGEQEVIPGRDDDDIVVFGIELLEKRNGAPSSTWNSDKWLIEFCEAQARASKPENI
jgi:hypothetical protein